MLAETNNTPTHTVAQIYQGDSLDVTFETLQRITISWQSADGVWVLRDGNGLELARFIPRYPHESPPQAADTPHIVAEVG